MGLLSQTGHRSHAIMLNNLGLQSAGASTVRDALHLIGVKAILYRIARAHIGFFENVRSTEGAQVLEILDAFLAELFGK